VPEKWDAKVEEWLKKMGYRFALRRFSYPEFVTSDRKLSFQSWWENNGVAPCYNKNFILAFRITNGTKSVVLVTDTGITSWLPGDQLFDGSIFIPYDVTAGKYDLQIGIVDKQSHEPKINLAIEGRTPEGWYSLGEIEIK